MCLESMKKKKKIGSLKSYLNRKGHIGKGSLRSNPNTHYWNFRENDWIRGVRVTLLDRKPWLNEKCGP